MRERSPQMDGWLLLGTGRRSDRERSGRFHSGSVQGAEGLQQQVQEDSSRVGRAAARQKEGTPEAAVVGKYPFSLLSHSFVSVFSSLTPLRIRVVF